MKNIIFLSIILLITLPSYNQQTCDQQKYEAHKVEKILDFSDPNAWEIIDKTASAQQSNNWEIGLFSQSNLQSSTNANGYAQIDSQGVGPTYQQDSLLILKDNIDMSDATIVTIEFEYYFQNSNGGNVFITWSVDGGVTLNDIFIGGTLVQNQNSDKKLFILSTQLAEQSQVKIGFRYQASNARFLRIDDVKITYFHCSECPNDKYLMKKQIYTNDFSDSTLWEITNEHVNNNNNKWKIQNDSNATTKLESATKDNGFAIIDSDNAGHNFVQDTFIMLKNSIDMSEYDHVLMKYTYFYRNYQSTSNAYVVTSKNDGFTRELTEVLQQYNGSTQSPNPSYEYVDLSNQLGNGAENIFGFRYTGAYSYYWLIDDIEVQYRECRECPYNCLNCDKFVCSQCEVGYFITGTGECDQCGQFCEECVSNAQCTTCQQGYYKDGTNTCQKCQISAPCIGCSTTNVCDTCQENYRLDDSNVCQECGDGCKRCDTDGCLDCQDLFYLENKACVAYPDNCEQINAGKTCINCVTSYYLKNEECLECIENCLNCDDNTGTCTECKENFRLQLDNTCLQCPLNCEVCNEEGKCTKCRTDNNQNLILNDETGFCEDIEEIELQFENFGRITIPSEGNQRFHFEIDLNTDDYEFVRPAIGCIMQNSDDFCVANSRIFTQGQIQVNGMEGKSNFFKSYIERATFQSSRFSYVSPIFYSDDFLNRQKYVCQQDNRFCILEVYIENDKDYAIDVIYSLVGIQSQNNVIMTPISLNSLFDMNGGYDTQFLPYLYEQNAYIKNQVYFMQFRYRNTGSQSQTRAFTELMMDFQQENAIQIYVRIQDLNAVDYTSNFQEIDDDDFNDRTKYDSQKFFKLFSCFDCEIQIQIGIIPYSVTQFPSQDLALQELAIRFYNPLIAGQSQYTIQQSSRDFDIVKITDINNFLQITRNIPEEDFENEKDFMYDFDQLSFTLSYTTESVNDESKELDFLTMTTFYRYVFTEDKLLNSKNYYLTFFYPQKTKDITIDINRSPQIYRNKFKFEEQLPIYEGNFAFIYRCVEKSSRISVRKIDLRSEVYANQCGTDINDCVIPTRDNFEYQFKEVEELNKYVLDIPKSKRNSKVQYFAVLIHNKQDEHIRQNSGYFNNELTYGQVHTLRENSILLTDKFIFYSDIPNWGYVMIIEICTVIGSILLCTGVFYARQFGLNKYIEAKYEDMKQIFNNMYEKINKNKTENDSNAETDKIDQADIYQVNVNTD